MGLRVVILEDDADRQTAMADCFQDRFPQYPIHFFATAVEMIWFLRRHLTDTIAIGLDHDLELVPVSNKQVLDGGSGRHVADFLATQTPVCPILIHTTNGPAGTGMEAVLNDAGWSTSRVTPYGNLEWVAETWFPAMRKAIVGFVTTRSAPAASATMP